MSMISQQDIGLLSTNALVHVATIDTKGEPQSSPVWFDWDGEFIKISLTKNRQKYRNLQREQRVALSIVDPQNPYHYLEIRGTVARIDENPQTAFPFIDALAKKYLNMDKYPNTQPGDERVIVYIKPEHTTHQI